MPENKQVPMPAAYHPRGDLLVHSVFPTIQGEGPFCGERALFIRLHGCNLRCPGCDTEYTAQLSEVGSDYLLRATKLHDWPAGALVVITGGEPLRQNIVPSVMTLLDAGYRVQIESNGVLCPPGMPWTHSMFSLVCSPKTTSINPEILANAAAFKYVIQADEVGHDGLPTRALQHPASRGVARPRPGALVYVQPMDEGSLLANAANLETALESTMKHGYRLQVQVHKIIGME